MKSHTTEHRVTYSDTDQFKVVYYANYFIYFEIGRREFFREAGYSVKDMERDGYHMVIVEAHCTYKSPARYDDVLLIKTEVAEVKRSSQRFDFKIFGKEDKKLLAEGHTVQVLVDPSGKTVNIPRRIRELFH